MRDSFSSFNRGKAWRLRRYRWDCDKQGPGHELSRWYLYEGIDKPSLIKQNKQSGNPSGYFEGKDKDLKLDNHIN